MVELPPAVIGDAQTSRFGWDVLEQLTDVGNRMAGSEGEHEGATIIRDAFADAGLEEPRLESFDIPGWWRGDSELSMTTPVERTHSGQQDVIALPGSPAETVEAEVIDVGTGSHAEFEAVAGELEGNIAMASSKTPEDADRWIHRMEKYVHAAERGAIGFIFRNHIEGALPPTGEIGYHNRPGPIPAVGVSSEVGARIARYTEDGMVSATLSVDSRNEPTTSYNAVAELGPDDAEQTVLVTAHVDAHDISDGANDNGAGSALVAEVGRLLTTVEEDLTQRIRFITFGAEEIGLWGAYHEAETTDLDSLSAVINLDGACSSRTLRIGTNQFDDLASVFEHTTDAFDAPLERGDTISPHGDQWAFVQEGVPAVMVSTASDKSGRGWGHTHADTLDKLDSRDFRAVAAQVTEAVYRIASDDLQFEHRSRAEMKDRIDDGYAQELKTGGRWPYDDLES